MPRGRRKSSRSRNNNQLEIKRDPHEILADLILKARNLTDKDIWNHSLGGKKIGGSQKKHRATEEEEDDELMHATELQTDYFHLTEQPKLINRAFGQLRPYQIEGVSWMANLRNNDLNGILADEMGLGKTLQTISMLAHLRETEGITGPHLIIVPKSTIYNWCREFEHWCPIFKVFPLQTKTKEERKLLVKTRLAKGQKHDWDILICSYDICMIEKSVLSKIKYCYIAVDEAHRLKNDASKFATILRTFPSKHRLLITGTPLQNNLRELWALLNFLLPQLFDNAEDFENLFDFGNSDEQHQQIFGQLRVLLKPFLLRRLKIHAEKDLPPKTESILFVGMSEMQQDVYKKILMRELQTITGGVSSANRALLNLVMQLRKAANHPYLFDGVEDLSLDPFGEHVISNCGKLCLLDKLLPRLRRQKSRCLIFSQMTRVLDILEDYCHIRRYPYCRIDGSTDGEERQQRMDDFNAENSKEFIFLLTTRAGGLGINLQSADIVIIYDSDWNPQMDLQAMDRAHRIGQKKPVMVYRLVTKDTVEERILERAELKLRLDAMVIQKNRKTGGASGDKKESLLEMVQYGADRIFQSKGSTITEDDIDSILAIGQKKTLELKNQWAKKVQKNFSELTLEFNYQEYDGTDYKQQRSAKNSNKNNNNGNNNQFSSQLDENRVALIQTISDNMGRSIRTSTAFGHRGKRVNYNENQYYRDRIQGINLRNANINNVNELTAPSKLPDIRYWQLYNECELYHLHQKEWDFFQKWRSNPEWDLINDDECINGALTEAETLRKQTLLSEGFPSISYRDFGAFVRACMKYGMGGGDDGDGAEDDAHAPPIDLIVDELKEEFAADAAVIRSYHESFFEKAPMIEELRSHLQRIRDGDTRRLNRLKRENEKVERKRVRQMKKEKWLRVKQESLLRKREKQRMAKARLQEQELKYRRALCERVENWKRTMIDKGKSEQKSDGNQSDDSDGQNKKRSRRQSKKKKKKVLCIFRDIQIPDARFYDCGFDKSIDRFLFLTTYEVGYGNWQALKARVVRHPFFQFNFLLQMQTPMQLKSRMETILRACISSKKSNKSKSKKNKKAAIVAPSASATAAEQNDDDDDAVSVDQQSRAASSVSSVSSMSSAISAELIGHKRTFSQIENLKHDSNEDNTNEENGGHLTEDDVLFCEPMNKKRKKMMSSARTKKTTLVRQQARRNVLDIESAGSDENTNTGSSNSNGNESADENMIIVD